MNFSGTCQGRLGIVPGVLSSPDVSMEKWEGLVDPELCFFFSPGRSDGSTMSGHGNCHWKDM